MRVKVISYDERMGVHLCQRPNGEHIRVDLNVDGGLGGIGPLDLIGKTVEYEWEHAYTTIAHHVRLADD